MHSAFFGTATDGKTFYHGHTYGGNPLGTAVALATLRVFEDERTLERLPPKVALLANRLARVRRLAARGRRPPAWADHGDRAGRGQSREDGLSVGGAGRCGSAGGRDFGLLIRPLGDVIVVMPPLSITCEQLGTMMDVVEDCIQSVTELEAR